MQIWYYTKRQIKSIYPHENFSIAGEIGNKTGIQCGTAEDLSGHPMPVYKERTHSYLTESIIGYTAIDNHTYLAVVKNVLMARTALLIFLCLFFASIGAYVLRLID